MISWGTFCWSPLEKCTFYESVDHITETVWQMDFLNLSKKGLKILFQYPLLEIWKRVYFITAKNSCLWQKKSCFSIQYLWKRYLQCQRLSMGIHSDREFHALDCTVKHQYPEISMEQCKQYICFHGSLAVNSLFICNIKILMYWMGQPFLSCLLSICFCDLKEKVHNKSSTQP